MKKLFLILSVLNLGFFCTQQSKSADPTPSSSPVELKDTVLVNKLNFPWDLVWGSDNFIWMTERTGRISRVNPESGAVSVIYNIPDVHTNGEGGLLGMALHPNFKTNPYVYVVYDYNSSKGYKAKVVRFTYNGTSLLSPLILLDDIGAASIHNGSRLLIVQDKLFITTGENGNQPLAQDKSKLNGKVLRINLDGSIPADNPINNSPIWSWGHRNPQGLVLVGNKIFSSEHGPDTDDEINIIEKGRNYGWPEVHGYCDEAAEKTFCEANNVKEPIKTWTPTAAVSGTDFYNNNKIPQWRNSLLVAALKNSRLYQLKLNDTQTDITETNEFFTSKYGRMRDVCVAPDGKVYICTSNGGDDKIIVVSAK